MINGYCKAKRLVEAMELFHEISQKGPIPNTVTYNTLMQGVSTKQLYLKGNTTSYGNGRVIGTFTFLHWDGFFLPVEAFSSNQNVACKSSTLHCRS
ncbi:hypothetical protein V6N13_014341 [Hibiscus sabdariffa]